MAKAPSIDYSALPQVEEHISLYYTAGSSNKAYNVHLVQSEDKSGWLVNFEYGKRGAALRPGTKTKDPVTFAAAKETYDKVVNGQLKDGYTQDESGAVYQSTSMEERFTGIVGQLLNTIDDDDLTTVERLINDPDWGMQEKFDGERRLVKITDAEVIGINKQGLRGALAMPMVEAVQALGVPALLDSEDMGSHFRVFDLLELDGRDLRALPYEQRYANLEKLLASTDDRLRLVKLVASADEKRALFEDVKKRNDEGVVFKRLAAMFTPGRPASGGDQHKYKFFADATVVVEKAHATKRSVSFYAFDENGEKVMLGNVTIPPNQRIPVAGEIIEVRYRNTQKGGSLYQPVFKMFRPDQTLADCTTKGLRYKSVNASVVNDDEIDEASVAIEAPIGEAAELATEASAPAKPKRTRAAKAA